MARDWQFAFGVNERGILFLYNKFNRGISWKQIFDEHAYSQFAHSWDHFRTIQLSESYPKNFNPKSNLAQSMKLLFLCEKEIVAARNFCGNFENQILVNSWCIVFFVPCCFLPPPPPSWFNYFRACTSQRLSQVRVPSIPFQCLSFRWIYVFMEILLQRATVRHAVRSRSRGRAVRYVTVCNDVIESWSRVSTTGMKSHATIS